MTRLVLNPTDFLADLRALVTARRLPESAYDAAAAVLNDGDLIPEDKLEELARILRAVSVRRLPDSWNADAAYFYVAAGPDEPTVLYSVDNDKFFISTWGEVYTREIEPQAHDEAWDYWIRDEIRKGVPGSEELTDAQLREMFTRAVRETGGSLVVQPDGAVAVHGQEKIVRAISEMMHGERSKNARGSRELDQLLDTAERSVSGRGTWRGSFEGTSIWLGDSSGSRVGQYEASLVREGRGINLRAKTFPALKRKIIAALAEHVPNARRRNAGAQPKIEHFTGKSIDARVKMGSVEYERTLTGAWEAYGQGVYGAVVRDAGFLDELNALAGAPPCAACGAPGADEYSREAGKFEGAPLCMDCASEDLDQAKLDRKIGARAHRTPNARPRRRRKVIYRVRGKADDYRDQYMKLGYSHRTLTGDFDTEPEAMRAAEKFMREQAPVGREAKVWIEKSWPSGDFSVLGKWVSEGGRWVPGR